MEGRKNTFASELAPQDRSTSRTNLHNISTNDAQSNSVAISHTINPALLDARRYPPLYMDDVRAVGLKRQATFQATRLDAPANNSTLLGHLDMSSTPQRASNGISIPSLIHGESRALEPKRRSLGNAQTSQSPFAAEMREALDYSKSVKRETYDKAVDFSSGAYDNASGPIPLDKGKTKAEPSNVENPTNTVPPQRQAGCDSDRNMKRETQGSAAPRPVTSQARRFRELCIKLGATHLDQLPTLRNAHFQPAKIERCVPLELLVGNLNRKFQHHSPGDQVWVTFGNDAASAMKVSISGPSGIKHNAWVDFTDCFRATILRPEFFGCETAIQARTIARYFFLLAAEHKHPGFRGISLGYTTGYPDRLRKQSEIIRTKRQQAKKPPTKRHVDDISTTAATANSFSSGAMTLDIDTMQDISRLRQRLAQIAEMVQGVSRTSKSSMVNVATYIHRNLDSLADTGHLSILQAEVSKQQNTEGIMKTVGLQLNEELRIFAEIVAKFGVEQVKEEEEE